MGRPNGGEGIFKLRFTKTLFLFEALRTAKRQWMR